MQGVEKERGKSKHLHGREEEAGRRARHGTVRLQEWDQEAGKYGLRMALSQDCELCKQLWGKYGLWTR